MRPRLLVAVPEPVPRDLYQEFLAQAGFDVHPAAGVADLVVLSSPRLPDLIVLDADLPWDADDGLTFFSLLSEHATAAPVPVVLLTAERDSSLLKALPFPISAVLVKPVSPLQLARRIWVLLEPASSRGLA